MQKIAIFDLDETITRKGTWGRFVTGAVRHQPLKWIPFFFSSLAQQVIYMLRLGPREHVKEKMMRWTIAGRTKTDLDKLAAEFADREMQSGLRTQTLAKIKSHKEAGDRIIIASAAVDLIVAPMAERLGFDERVCTKTAFDTDNKLKSKLGGMNCYGPGKLVLVKEHLAADKNFDRKSVHITMYSDSRSDLDILRWADIGIAVNPSPRLAKVVEQEGFDVQDWDLEE